MKFIRAIIRPEREKQVLSRLEEAGFFPMTKYPVSGCGRQGGVRVGPVSYDELAKLMLFLVVEDREFDRALKAIEEGAFTGYPGDGKIFSQNVREVVTVRTGSREIIKNEKG